tara:strand:- start:17 stop:211 length:195 start_codon:yes stop_codon:yes gene_type:complete
MHKEIIWPKNGEAYQVVRVMPMDRFKPNPDISILKKFFRCDTVLRNDGHLYFCNLIPSIPYEEV